MRVSLGYPEERVEKELLLGAVGRSKLSTLSPLLTPEEFLSLKQVVQTVQIFRCDFRLHHAIGSKNTRQHPVRVGFIPSCLSVASKCREGLRDYLW